MLLRTLIVLSLLLSATGLGVLGIQLLMPPAPPVEQSAEAAPPPPARVRIIVATRALSLGTPLKDEDLGVREFPAEAVPEGAIELSEEMRTELRGALLRRYLDPNTPVLRGDVLRPRDRGFLAAVLRPGMRAISIKVDAASSTSGLISPGDRVDVILTNRVSDPGNVTNDSRLVGQTVLASARVLALDQRLSDRPQDAEGQKQNNQQVVRAVPETVTLEVTPKDAERLSIAVRLGDLTLSLKAFARDEKDGETESAGTTVPVSGATTSPVTFDSEVSSALRPQTGAPTGLTVMRGSVKKNEQ